jgi:isoquinoline 1-oxidoreductase alpha subunit
LSGAGGGLAGPPLCFSTARSDVIAPIEPPLGYHLFAPILPLIVACGMPQGSVGGGMTRLTINGQAHELDVDSDMPLLWLLRDILGLMGTKYGCGIGQCGACTTHVEGAPVRSCLVTVGMLAGRRITTIEGLAENGALHPVQRAWLDLDVPQCGYCQSGMIMAVAALLEQKPHPSDDDIDTAISNICRCGTYQRVRAAIHAAAALGQP